MAVLNRYSTFIFIVFCGIVLSVVNCEETEKPLIIDCKKIMGRIVKKTVKIFGVCTKEVKGNSTKEEFEKKMHCIIKCSMDKMGVLTEKGIVTKESIQVFMDKMIPVEAHDMGHALMKDCLAEHGTKLDKDAPFCETYGELAACLQNFIGEFADKANCGIGALG